MAATHNIDLGFAACSDLFPGANCHLGENIREEEERGLGGAREQGVMDIPLEPPPAKVVELAAQEPVHQQEVEDDIEDTQHLVTTISQNLKILINYLAKHKSPHILDMGPGVVHLDNIFGDIIQHQLSLLLTG